MRQREVLRAALGNRAPLAALRGREALGEALRAAAAAGLLVPLGDLLRRGGEVAVDSRASNGDTALIAAAQGGHVRAVEALLKAGAAVSTYSHNGCTALQYAEELKHEPVAQLLRTHGES